MVAASPGRNSGWQCLELAKALLGTQTRSPRAQRQPTAGHYQRPQDARYMQMLHHISLGVANIERAAELYDAIFEPLVSRR